MKYLQWRVNILSPDAICFSNIIFSSTEDQHFILCGCMFYQREKERERERERERECRETESGGLTLYIAAIAYMVG